MPSCLGPIAYTYNLDRRNLQYFTSLMTSIYNFLIFLNLSPSIMTTTPWSIASVKGGVARKSCHFTQNPNFAYSLKLNTNIYIYKSFVIYELDANIFIFRFFEPFSLNYDQNTLGYCFIERWCCQKIMPFYLKCQFCLGPKLKTYIYTFKIEIFSILRV